WCADDDFLVYAGTEIGQGLVDGTRSLPCRLVGCLNNDEQIDVAVRLMRAPGATAKENNFLRINRAYDSIDNLFRELGCEVGQISRDTLREYAHLVRIAQSIEEHVAPVANIFADLDEIPAVPLVLFTNTIGSGNPAVLRSEEHTSE